MKISKRTQSTIDIFLDALNEGTLAKGTCLACACGNIIAKALGIKSFIHESKQDYSEYCNQINGSELGVEWSTAIWSGNVAPKFVSLISIGKKQIEKTGYTVEEFKSIEKTFEENTEILFPKYRFHTKEEIRADQIKGLQAVVNLLLKWNNSTEDIKEVFTNKAELIPC